jgi:hypothetical protein
VPNLSLQIIWHKHLRRSSYSASYSHSILWLELCQTQPAEQWVQLCLCPHRLLLLHSPQLSALQVTGPRVVLSSSHPPLVLLLITCPSLYKPNK